MKRGDRIDLRVDALAFGGDAVGRAEDGRVVFVAGGAPGDQLRVVVDEAKRDYARASIEEILAAGASRVAPRCPLVGRCGGCQWQSVAIEAQRAAKQEILARALGRIGVALEPLLTPGEPFGYRTRARYTVGGDQGDSPRNSVSGGTAIGFQEHRSHRVVDVDSCALLAPALDGAMAKARRALEGKLAAGGTISGLLGRDGAVHLAITGAKDAAVAAARALVAEGHAAGVIVDGLAIGSREIDASDEGEAPFHAAADGFAQASREGNRALRSLVFGMAHAEGLRVLELHAGDGNFTRDLAARAASVLAIEGDANAVARLRRNVPRAQARAEPVERAAERLARDGERFDLALIDPPRAGALAIVPALARLAARLVYVSCDPMTLARDLRALADAGLVPMRAAAVDMMPHTYHVECVVELAAKS